MKMISTPTAVAANQYTAYVHNCLRNRACEPSYSAPLPGVPFLQLYVDFGANKPFTADFELLNHCNGETEQIFPSNFVVGQDPEGNWYGVFKNFNTPLTDLTTFVVWLSALVDTPTGFQERTFFSEMMVVEPCAPLTKIKACHPEGATTTAFDVNDLYYGLPQNVDYLGIGSIRYFHIAYVRLGKLREISNKATFKSSLTRNFRTQFERIHQVDTELVPQWYKDVIVAIYLRGAISVDDGPTMVVSDLAVESINDDDLIWRPSAQVKKTTKLYFGCDDSACVECCAPTIYSATNTSDGTGSGSGSGSESEPGPVDPPTAVLQFLTYQQGVFYFTLSNPIPSTSIIITGARATGYFTPSCVDLPLQSDDLTISNFLTIPAGSYNGNKAGGTPLNCVSASWKRTNSITVNGLVKTNGQTMMIGGTLVTISIPTACAGPYIC
jgi:hypothetical protein